MSVSPADYELYSRVTGRPMPRTPQEQMPMAPEVFKFTREFGRGQQRISPRFVKICRKVLHFPGFTLFLPRYMVLIPRKIRPNRQNTSSSSRL